MGQKSSKYSNITEALDKLKKQGYERNLIVYDYDLAKLENGEERTSDDLVLQEVHWFDKHQCPTDDLVIYALMDHSGHKLLVKDSFGKYGSEVVLKFISNVSKKTPTL